MHYKRDGIATFDAATEKVVEYMSAGNRPLAAFKSHRLMGVSGGVVTVEAEIDNPDRSTFQTTIKHRLDPPNGIETTMIGGAFDGARFVHAYTPVGGRTRVDLEGDFPALPAMSEADEFEMIDGFFAMVFNEDIATLRTCLWRDRRMGAADADSGRRLRRRHSGRRRAAAPAAPRTRGRARRPQPCVQDRAAQALAARRARMIADGSRQRSLLERHGIEFIRAGISSIDAAAK